jgi:hypothetical protein
MARRKKRVYSTKPRTAEGVLAPADTEEAEAQPDPVVPAPEPGKFTLDQAIERFKKNPREEQFWCPGQKGFALAAGDMYLQFKDHFLTTSNPAEVEALMRSNDPGAKYNVQFFAMSPELRNIKSAK